MTIEVKPEELLILSPENLRALRKRAGLTQGELATLLGVARRTVERWESGQRKPRDTTLIRRIVLALAPEKITDPSEAHIDLGDIQISTDEEHITLVAWGENGTPFVVLVTEAEKA